MFRARPKSIRCGGLAATTVLLALALSCTGTIQVGDPSVEVAKLQLMPDMLGGLQVADCVNSLGAESCPVLPNDFECDSLEISVRGDASTVGICKTTVAGMAQVQTIRIGVPISCRMDQVLGCIQCRDTADRAVLDTCEGETSLYTGTLPEDLPGNSGVIVGEDSVDAPPPTGDAKCNPDLASDLFELQVNQILRSEGLKFSFIAPRGEGKGSKFKAQMCTKDKSIVNMLKKGCEGEAQKEGFCYCWLTKKSEPACRAARIVAKAVSEACSALPDGCDKQWNKRLWGDRAAATTWLMKGSYGDKGWLGDGVGNGQLPPTGDGGAAVKRSVFNDVLGPKGITAKGSPLVLDLQGDGIRLTSAVEGVRFDLLGASAYQTAWVAGADDALLALDRDGNGRIDGGVELFGEATALDGFQALAALDDPAQGGNGNGLVEGDDLMFGQLRLWLDANRDGVSQPGELRPLDAEGITALLTTSRRSGDTDAHGNELALRSSFLRADGEAGALVDVFLVNR
jgi:hypothetical protein